MTLIALLCLACALCLVLFLVGNRTELTIVPYTIQTGKLERPVRLALLTDLHSCRYGSHQQQLLQALEHAAPDAILLGGDFFDDHLPPEPALTLLQEAAPRWPVFYVSGNHEYRTGQIDAIKTHLRAAGVMVLEGTCHPFTVRGQTIQLCGVDDPEGVGMNTTMEQLFYSSQQTNPHQPCVLLVHRPEHVDQYRRYLFDLALSGHAHGGQWRIPGLLNGLFAPGQGWFPRYAGGRYDFGSFTMVVSRGLARETTKIPRLFNPPELVLLDLQ